jgi:hypothetical protein
MTRATALSAALVAAFAHVHMTLTVVAQQAFLHSAIVRGVDEDPVNYRVLLPLLVERLAPLLPFPHDVSVVALHLLFGALAVSAWVYGAYRLLCVWLPSERALIGCLWLALVYAALTLTLPGLIAYTPLEAALLTWGLVWLYSR